MNPHSNPKFLSLVFYSALTISVGQETYAASHSESQPNVLFIMSDDHTTQALGAYGSRLAALDPTPHIDALAEGGMRFDRVFCNNSICTPSRSSIITGQYPQRNGVLDLRDNLPAERQFLPKAEMNNLYGDPAYKDLIDKMKSQLQTTREALDETDRVYPELQRVIRAHRND